MVEDESVATEDVEVRVVGDSEHEVANDGDEIEWEMQDSACTASAPRLFKNTDVEGEGAQSGDTGRLTLSASWNRYTGGEQSVEEGSQVHSTNS